jgi:hypothetical protein
LLYNTKKAHPQASQEGFDTYKYSDYPESGISPQQHALKAVAGPPAAAPAVPAAAPAAPPAGGVPLVVSAAAGPIHPAALLGFRC